MAASSQSIRRSLRGSSPTVSYSHPTEPGSHEPEFRKLWRESGSLNHQGEFRQWLHVFALAGKDDGVPSILQDRSLPWPNLMPKPCMETLLATDHMTQMVHYPSGWEHWKYSFAEITLDAERKLHFGPYWMLLARPDTGCLASELVALKRRIQNEMFRDADPWSARSFEQRMIESMEPFLINTQEKA